VLGNVRERPLADTYRHAPQLHALRDMDRLKGRCGRCEFRWICGGSRARAFAVTGDCFAEDPLCDYQPARGAIPSGSAHAPNTWVS
jgi:radical SAM protein with 4Fe4S-binding SPASM domain